MIKSFALSAILLLSAFSVFAQKGESTELDSLKKQTAGFLAQREYGKLIPTAIRIVEMEKTAGTGDSYKSALKNLALWRRLRLIDLVKAGQHRTPDFGVDVDATEGNFRELVMLAESDPDQLRLAAALVDLAEFLDRFGRPFPIVEETYLRALAIYEKASQGDSDDALKTVAALADSYFYQAEYEKYYPLNRRYVAAVEKISGRMISASYPPCGRIPVS